MRLRERSASFWRDPPRDTRSLAHRTSRTAARRKGESDVGGRRLAAQPWLPVMTSQGRERRMQTPATPCGQTRAPLTVDEREPSEEHSRYKYPTHLDKFEWIREKSKSHFDVECSFP